MEKNEKVPVWLLPEGEWRRYDKKYVAMPGFFYNKVIGTGDTPEEALAQAQTSGCTDPVVFFVFDGVLNFVGRIMNFGDLLNSLINY